MYNHYISQDSGYGPIPAGADRPQHAAPPPKGGPGGLSGLLSALLRGEQGGGDKVAQSLSALLGSFGLKNLDAGDILLGLIVLFLILEDGDDLDLVITLALTILFSLGEP